MNPIYAGRPVGSIAIPMSPPETCDPLPSCRIISFSDWRSSSKNSGHDHTHFQRVPNPCSKRVWCHIIFPLSSKFCSRDVLWQRTLLSHHKAEWGISSRLMHTSSVCVHDKRNQFMPIIRRSLTNIDSIIKHVRLNRSIIPSDSGW